MTPTSTSTDARPYIREIQANIKRFADMQGLTLEDLAERSGEPLSALTGDRIFLRSIERVARTLKVPVDIVFGFGGCQPWCDAHEDDGDSDYCCRRVGTYGAEALPVEIWYDSEGVQINFEDLPRGRRCTPDEARDLAAALTRALVILDESAEIH